MEDDFIALTDQGARYTFLGEAFRIRRDIPNDQIVDVDFSRIKISDADVKAILPLTHLQGISFWNCDVSDDAIHQIRILRHLTRLNLCGTKVTDASVPTLIEMRLGYIDVADTGLTPSGIAALRAGLPEAEILD